ncbi:zinc metalloprotease HtpX [Thiobacter aerophilum]|uniref:Zinc metalloprotease HtpX n=1 Tax=Thiobacter aerophilum TaxID=3121275 RepID=A0ABV0EFX7_9BURK
MSDETWRRHARANRLQSLLLAGVLLAIAAQAGWLLLGESGLWAALGAAVVALAVEPAAATRLTLRLYGARPLTGAPALEQLVAKLAARAQLARAPRLYWVGSPVANAFAVGSRDDSHIVLTEGLLRNLDWRELAGVLAHEIAHIAQDDLRVMGLADYVSRLTALVALVAQMLLLVSLPAWLAGAVDIQWPGLLLLLFSPQLALLAQLGLSRVREFDADLMAARLTGDPEGLAAALAKIERVSRSWKSWLMPGWGNPEPSWLRTHPATEERIARLRALKQGSAEAQDWQWPGSHVRPPRWHPLGIWR